MAAIGLPRSGYLEIWDSGVSLGIWLLPHPSLMRAIGLVLCTLCVLLLVDGFHVRRSLPTAQRLHQRASWLANQRSLRTPATALPLVGMFSAKPMLNAAKGSKAVAPAPRLGIREDLTNCVRFGMRLWRHFEKQTGIDLTGFGLILTVIGLYYAFWLPVGLLGEYLLLKEKRDTEEKIRKELEKDKLYRQGMYVDGVVHLTTKLANPQLTDEARKELDEELRLLDPDGRIRAFIENGEKGTLDISAQFGPGKVKPKKTKKRKNRDKAISLSDFAGEGDAGSAEAVKATDELMDKLKQSLKRMDPVQRDELIKNMKMRLVAINDPDKRKDMMQKIEDKLGDTTYWDNVLSTLK